MIFTTDQVCIRTMNFMIPTIWRTKILIHLIIHLCFMYLCWMSRVPEDDLKKTETCRSMSGLYVEVYTGRSHFTPGIHFWKCHANWSCANQIQNFYLKPCISWGLGDWPHPKWCMTTQLVDIQTSRMYNYVLYIPYTYISIQYIYLFLI